MNKPCIHGEADGFFITEVCGPSARVLWKCHHRGSRIGLCVLVPDEEALRHSWLCAAADRTKTVGVAYLQGRQTRDVALGCTLHSRPYFFGSLVLALADAICFAIDFRTLTGHAPVAYEL